jgi:hypothetical protein
VNGIGPQMTIIKTIKDIMKENTKTMSMKNNEYKAPDLQQAYSKCINVIMKCRTEEQLRNAGRYLRNYERLMQNSHLYPTIRKPLAERSVSNLLSLIKIKRKEFLDL